MDPAHPASFSNPQTLYKVAKKEGNIKYLILKLRNGFKNKNHILETKG